MSPYSDTSEKGLEVHITRHLCVVNGFEERHYDQYNRSECVDEDCQERIAGAASAVVFCVHVDTPENRPGEKPSFTTCTLGVRTGAHRRRHAKSMQLGPSKLHRPLRPAFSF